MKRIISLILVSAMLFGLLPYPAVAAETVITTEEAFRGIVDDPSGTYSLGASLSLSPETVEALQNCFFTGNLYGNGHTITASMDQVAGRACGLFSGIGGTVQDLTLNATIELAAGTSVFEVGLLASNFDSNAYIYNCDVTGSITVNDPSQDSYPIIGGIIGNGHGVIDCCNVNVDISLTTSGSGEVGGIAGALYSGQLFDCHYNGNISVTQTGSNSVYYSVAGVENAANCTVSGTIRVDTTNATGQVVGLQNAQNSVNHAAITLTARSDGIYCVGASTGTNLDNTGAVTLIASGNASAYSCYAYGLDLVTNGTNSGTVFAQADSPGTTAIGVAQCTNCSNIADIIAINANGKAVADGAGMARAKNINEGTIQATATNGMAMARGISGYTSSSKNCINKGTVTATAHQGEARAHGIENCYNSENQASVTANSMGETSYNSSAAGASGEYVTNRGTVRCEAPNATGNAYAYGIYNSSPYSRNYGTVHAIAGNSHAVARGVSGDYCENYGEVTATSSGPADDKYGDRSSAKAYGTDGGSDNSYNSAKITAISEVSAAWAYGAYLSSSVSDGIAYAQTNYFESTVVNDTPYYYVGSAYAQGSLNTAVNVAGTTASSGSGEEDGKVYFFWPSSDCEYHDPNSIPCLTTEKMDPEYCNCSYGVQGTAMSTVAKEYTSQIPNLDEEEDPEENPTNASISVEIKEESVFKNYRIACGTVMDEDTPVERMETSLILIPKDGSFRTVKLRLTLPEGFSFDADELVKEENITKANISGETTVEIPTIYPIYLEKQENMESYSLKIDVTAIDTDGKRFENSEAEIFYEPSEVNYTVSFRGDGIKNAEPYEFSLDTAFGSGTSYNQETARLSAMLSAMAYEEDNLRQFLVSDMGFSNLEVYGMGKGTADFNTGTVGRYFASKKIIQDGKIKNAVYVVCRGTVLEEWLGNFNAGVGMPVSNHRGFVEAAQYVEDELLTFWLKHNMTKENTLVLVTGHSRAAAVSMIVGNWLNMNEGISTKENISVYAYAAPTVNKLVVSEELGQLGNENIFNFVNYQDLIRNAPSMHYYGRYGKTTIFAFDTTVMGAAEHNDGYGVYALPLDGFNYTMGEVMNAIVYDADTECIFSVSKALQRLIYFTTCLRSLYDRNVLDLKDELMAAHDMALYYNAVVNQASGAETGAVNARTEEALNYFLTSPTVKEAFLKELAKYTSPTIRLITHVFACPIDLYVRDAEGNVVASIVDKQVSCSDANLQLVVCGDALMVCYLETEDGNYSFQVEGYDDGAVTHCVQTIDMEGTQTLYKRADIPVATGEILEVNGDGYIPVGDESDQEAEQAYRKFGTAEEMEAVLDGLQQPEEVSGTAKTPNEAVSEMTWGVNLSDLYMADVERQEGSTTGYIDFEPAAEIGMGLWFWNSDYHWLTYHGAQRGTFTVQADFPDFGAESPWEGDLFRIGIMTTSTDRMISVTLSDSKIVKANGEVIALPSMDKTYTGQTALGPDINGWCRYEIQCPEEAPEENAELNGATLYTTVTIEEESLNLTSKADYYFQYQRYPISQEESTDLFLAAGANVIRLPVTWTPFVNDTTFEIDPEWLEAVKSEVDYILSQGAYCILNMHNDYLQRSFVATKQNGQWVNFHWERNWMEEQYREYVDARFAAVWKQIAEYFKDYSDLLIFETCNEPTVEWSSDVDYDPWINRQAARINEMNRLFVETVRNTGGGNTNRILCLAVAEYNQHHRLSQLELPEDDYLMVQIHAYMEMENDHHSGAWDPNYDYKAETDALFEDVTAFRRGNPDVPVIIGELGVTHRVEESLLVPRVEYFFTKAEENGVPCLWWEDYFVAEDNRQYWLYDKDNGQWGRTEILRTIQDIVGCGTGKHTEEKVPGKAPTCTENGLTEGVKCTACGMMLTAQKEIPALEHSFRDGQCTVCGTKDPDYVAPTEPTEPIEPEQPTEPDEPEIPYTTGVKRLAGDSRYETSFAIATEMKRVLGIDKFNAVVLANSDNFADALAGSYLAAQKQAPIIIGKEKYKSLVCDYLNANLAEGATVYILGGEDVMPDSILANLNVRHKKIRLAGDDRYLTNLEILNHIPIGSSDVLVATGRDFADSLSASATGLPILLVNGKAGKTLSDAQKEFLAGVTGKIYIIGGESAVPETMVAQIEAASGKKAERIAGSSRYETSVKIAEKFLGGAESAVVAYASTFPDGLCGGPLAYAVGAPLILTKDGKSEAPAYTTGNNITSGYVLGGDGLISDGFAKTIFQATEIIK